MRIEELVRTDWAVVTGLSLILLDVVSLAAYVFPFVNWVVLPVIVVAYACALYLKPKAALAVPLAELAWGSFGASLAWDLGMFHVTLRTLLFVLTLGMFLFRIRSLSFPRFFRSQSGAIALSIAAAVAWGLAVALVRQQPFNQLYLDVNAYLFGLYVLPWAAVLRREDLPMLASVVVGAAMALAGKTLFLFHVFASGYEFLNPHYLYLWIRDTRIGEITLAGSVWRIFIQSQLYIGIVLLGAILAAGFSRRMSFKYLTAVSILAAALLASSSRSYWLGFAVALVSIAAVSAVLKLRMSYARTAVALGSSLVCAILLLVVLVLPSGGRGAAMFLAGRISLNDAAGSSRMQQLPPLLRAIGKHVIAGSGFGQTVTFSSSDPRIRTPQNPSGTVNTYAFEWGYLDQLLKMGFIGFAVFAGALLYLAYCLASALKRAGDRAAPMTVLFSGLIFIAAVHMTSPYLNHPLGIGYLALLLAILYARTENAYAPSLH